MENKQRTYINHHSGWSELVILDDKLFFQNNYELSMFGIKYSGQRFIKIKPGTFTINDDKSSFWFIRELGEHEEYEITKASNVHWQGVSYTTYIKI